MTFETSPSFFIFLAMLFPKIFAYLGSFAKDVVPIPAIASVPS